MKVNMKVKKREGEHTDGKEVKCLFQIMWIMRDSHSGQHFPLLLKLRACTLVLTHSIAPVCVPQYWSRHFQKPVFIYDVGTSHCSLGLTHRIA